MYPLFNFSVQQHNNHFILSTRSKVNVACLFCLSFSIFYFVAINPMRHKRSQFDFAASVLSEVPWWPFRNPALPLWYTCVNIFNTAHIFEVKVAADPPLDRFLLDRRESQPARRLCCSWKSYRDWLHPPTCRPSAITKNRPEKKTHLIMISS